MRLPRTSSSATALVAMLIVLVATAVVADRLGAPAAVIEAAALALALAALGLAGAMNATMRPSTFHMAGGRLGPLRAVSLVCVLGVGVAMLLGGGDGLTLGAAVNVAAGLILAAVFYAAPLRRAGAPGLGAFALARYRSRLLCVLAGLTVVAVAAPLAALAMSGAVERLSQFTGLPQGFAAALIALAALAMVLPGGLASLAGASVIAMLVLSAGYGLPLGALGLRLEPAAGDAIVTVAEEIRDLSLSPLAALAAAGLMAVLGPANAARDGARARESFAAAALAVLGAAACAASLAVAVSLAAASIPGQPVERLPAAIYAPAARDLIRICGVAPADQASVQAACAGRLVDGLVPAEAVAIRAAAPRWAAVALELPLIFGAIQALGPVFVLIALMAALLRAAAAALVGEVIHPIGDRLGTASGRLALFRLVFAALAIGLAQFHGAILTALVSDALRGWDRFALFALAVLPAALILPARLRAADWRAPAAVVLAAAALAAAAASGHLSSEAALRPAILALVPLSGLAALLAFRSRDPFDARAADIVADRHAGPIVRYADA